MPIFEFSCQKCHYEFELFVKNNETNGWRCPQCASEQVKKKFSVFGVKSKSASGQTKTVGSSCSSCASSSCSTCS